MFAALTLENLIVPIIAISFTSVIGLMTWMVRELSRISTTLSVMDERSQNIVRRIENLEDEQRHIVRILD
jgi:type II secretory pathway component PulJ